MIHQAIQHIVSELNAYLNLRSPSLDTERVMLGSLFDLSGNPNADAQEKVLISLVNVQQDPVYHTVELYEKRPDGKAELVRPEVRVNLFLLFVANLADYEEALKAVEHVISYFQAHHVFDYAVIPSLADQQGRLVFELYSMTFEQQNHLWGALGSKYQPSVMYKLGLVGIRDRQIEAEVRPVEQVLINE
jgi:hypothetical protein